MTDSELPELEKAETWDFETAERRPGVKGTRTVVSVAFSRDDFERVSAWAEHVGKRTSEFIREAALERVGRQGSSATLSSSSGPGWLVVTHKPTPTTRVSGASASKQLEPDEGKVLTS
jgi:hypothetical protein